LTLADPDSVQSRPYGGQSVSTLGLLDYRYALDAAMSLLAGAQAPLVLCQAPPLAREGLPPSAADSPTNDAALWIEPLADTWQADLAALVARLAENGQLIVLLSRPLALLLPTRRAWNIRALGTRLGGVRQLQGALARAGLRLDAAYGIHTMMAMGLNRMSQQLERRGRPDLGDPLHFAARLRYCARGPLAALSTVALLIATRVRE
jgi:hypothetical protein